MLFITVDIHVFKANFLLFAIPPLAISCIQQILVATVSFGINVGICSHNKTKDGHHSRYYGLCKFSLDQAKLALDSLEVPVGCTIVNEGNNVIASGRNRTTESQNATRHVEMEAIDVLLDQWRKNGLRKTGLSKAQVADKFSICTLYVTCELCIICAAALFILGIKQVYYGCANDKFGGCRSILSLHSGSIQTPTGCRDHTRKGFKCQGGIMASEAISLLRTFKGQVSP